MPPGPDDTYSPNFISAAVPGGIFLSVLLLILLIAVSAVFSFGSFSVLEHGSVKLRETAKDASRRADSEHIFSAMRAGVTFLDMFTAAAVSVSFAGRLAGVFSPPAEFAPLVYWVCAAVIMLLLTYVSLLFGRVLPEKAAVRRGAGGADYVSPLTKASYLFRPMASLLSSSADALMRLAGYDGGSRSAETITQREILWYSGLKDKSGGLSGKTKAMISNILEFSGRTATDVMTHRTEVDALEDTDSVPDAVSLAMGTGHSRIPVFREDLDNILGVIYIKDLLKFVGSPITEGVELTGLMHTAYFVPESKLCSEIFSEMTARRIQIAVVVDEYGGTEGIITMEDLLESIVGDIQDEYDNEEDEVRRIGENRFNVDGGASIEEISELIGVELPQGDYDTLAGLIMDRLGSIPKPNEHPQINIDGISFTVAAMDDKRIARVAIEKKPCAPDAPKVREDK